MRATLAPARVTLWGDSWKYTKTPRLPDGSPIRLYSSSTRGVGRDARKKSFLSSDGSGLLVWSAVRADQKALVDREAKDRHGSVFTRRLLWGGPGRQGG